MLHAQISPTPPDSLVEAVVGWTGHSDGQQWSALKGGRTNRLWRVGNLVVKLYDPAGATPLFPNDPTAETASLTAFGPLGLGPILVASLDGAFGSAVIYRFAEGSTGFGEPDKLAGLLARVHGQVRPEGLRLGANGSTDLLNSTASVITEIKKISSYSSQIKDLRLHLQSLPSIREASRAVVHSDPVSTNVVDTPGGPMLIDWQCPCWGDPCEDLAVVLSPSMQMHYGRLPNHGAQVFLEAYPDQRIVQRYQALAPFYHLRFAAYALWSLQQGRTQDPAAVDVEIEAAWRSLTPERS